MLDNVSTNISVGYSNWLRPLPWVVEPATCVPIVEPSWSCITRPLPYSATKSEPSMPKANPHGRLRALLAEPDVPFPYPPTVVPFCRDSATKQRRNLKTMLMSFCPKKSEKVCIRISDNNHLCNVTEHFFFLMWEGMCLIQIRNGDGKIWDWSLHFE